MERTTIGLPNTCSVCGTGGLPYWYAKHAEAATAGQGVCEACAFPLPPPPPPVPPEHQAPPELAELIGPDEQPLDVPPDDLASALAVPAELIVTPEQQALADDPPQLAGELITDGETHEIHLASPDEDPDGLHLRPEQRDAGDGDPEPGAPGAGRHGRERRRSA